MMTEDDERTLDYEKFSQLILSIVSAAGITFNEAADAMTLSMLQEKAISKGRLDQFDGRRSRVFRGSGIDRGRN
jgi:hypothetical protein